MAFYLVSDDGIFEGNISMTYQNGAICVSDPSQKYSLQINPKCNPDLSNTTSDWVTIDTTN